MPGSVTSATACNRMFSGLRRQWVAGESKGEEVACRQWAAVAPTHFKSRWTTGGRQGRSSGSSHGGTMEGGEQTSAGQARLRHTRRPQRTSAAVDVGDRAADLAEEAATLGLVEPLLLLHLVKELAAVDELWQRRRGARGAACCGRAPSDWAHPGRCRASRRSRRGRTSAGRAGGGAPA